MKFARLIAVWLLMLTLPLQALAAYAPVMPCAAEHATVIQQTHADRTGHQAMMAAADQSPCEHQQQNNGPATDFDGHSCCHPVFTGVAPVTLPFAPEAPRVITQRIALLSTLFIPELPQRPPRA